MYFHWLKSNMYIENVMIHAHVLKHKIKVPIILRFQHI